MMDKEEIECDKQGLTGNLFEWETYIAVCVCLHINPCVLSMSCENHVSPNTDLENQRKTDLFSAFLLILLTQWVF